ncbi:MAG: TetR/AcrR family transcriptional regulator [Proteobacteria bacterium]|nr:TetR/AcrR family transcriptional regulator [Pseudomonadota bacterium]
MARRYDHSREELYEMILNEAHRQVMDGGLRSLSARKIAKEIGYSVGTIYNLFSNFDDLILHLNGRTLDLLFENLSVPPETLDPEDQLRELSMTYIKFTRTNQNLWNCLFDNRLLIRDGLPEWYNKKIDKLLELIEKAIAPLFSSLNSLERHQSAWVLWCSFHGICSLANFQSDNEEATTYAATLTDQLITNYIAGLKVYQPQ